MDAIVCDVCLQRCVLSEGRCHKYFFFFNCVIIFLHLTTTYRTLHFTKGGGWVGVVCTLLVRMSLG